MHWGFLAVLATLGLSGDQPADGQGVPCMVREGFRFVVLDEPNCSDLLGSERIRGTWFVANEGSSFLPAGSPLPVVRIVSDASRESEIWLHMDWPEQRELLQSVPEPAGTGDTLMYEVEFIGRRARDAGEYGHAGSRHLIVVDRMLSIRPIGKVRTWIEWLGCFVPECTQAHVDRARRGGRLD